MKKKLLIGLGILVLVLYATFTYLPGNLLSMITEYDPYTFEYVFDNEDVLQTYDLNGSKTPADYGFDYEDVSFYTADSSLLLSAWFMPQLYDSIPSDKAIILVHGRTSNRLKPMKYLELFRTHHIDSGYHVFLPDMRNSGQSPIAETAMGYLFAEDLAGGIRWLATTKGIRHVVLYAFSMGAQASNTLLIREELMDIVHANNVSIDALVFDSPLANVEATLLKNGKEKGIPSFITSRILSEFDNQYLNGKLNKMKIHQGINQFKNPVILLQSKEDAITHYDIFENETLLLRNRDKLYIKVFEKGEHVRIYTEDSEREAYSKEVIDFIKGIQ